MYGYKTENGITEINTEEAEIIKAFLNNYISGFSIKQSKEISGIPLSEHALQHLLENDIYLGKNRYPSIIDKRTFSKISKIRNARTHGATRTTEPIVPVCNSLLPVQVVNVA